jgi:hypothetical protein
MPIDYKTAQAFAAKDPSGTAPYCPECGRPWVDPAREQLQSSTPHPWRAVLLGVVGLFLAITFGLRAASFLITGPRDCTGVRQTIEFSMDSGWTADCIPDRASPLPRDLLVMASGVTIALIGFVTLARRYVWTRQNSRDPSRVATIWDVSQTMLALGCLQGLALYVDLVAGRHSLGLPLTWETLDRITDEVFALFSIITGI